MDICSKGEESMKNKSGAPGPQVAWFLVVVLIAGPLFLGSDVFVEGDRMPTRSETIHVGSGYSYTTIGSAISAASAGDHIVVHPGIYNESVTLDKKLELHGTEMNNTIINGKGRTALIVTADNCKISGLNLTGGLPIGWSGEETWTAGLELKSDLNEVYGIYMQNNYFGALMRDTDNNWIHDCISSNNKQHGVFLSGSSGNRFDSFHSLNNGYNGFGFFVSPDNDFYHCRSEGNVKSGWEIWDSEREYIRFCTANYNGRIGFMVGGSFDKNWFENCEAIGNTEEGFWLYVEAYQMIENCTIVNNGGSGIYLPYNGYASKAIVYNNLIMNNTNWAVRIENDCDNSEFYSNDIINNRNGQTPQVTDDGDKNIWNKESTGNYWNEWVSPDSNSDGIVDAPYTNNGASSSKDNFPSTRRFTNHSYGSTIGVGPYVPCIVRSFPGDAVVGENYSVKFEAVDRDTPQDELTWGFTTLATWLSMEGNVLSGRPSHLHIGIHTIEVWVTDGTGIDEFIFNIEVEKEKDEEFENEYPPSIITSHIKSALVGVYYTHEYSALDQDTDIKSLHWEVTTTSTFLTMNGNVLEGMPTANDIGAFTVSIMVTDGDYFDISSFTLMVYPQDSVVDDDVGTEIEVIDIVQGPRMETGETILSVMDLTEGKVNFIEFEWYIDGALIGGNSLLVVFLEDGTHSITLRARALDNDWYEVNKDVKVGGIPSNSDRIDDLALIVVIVLGVVIIMIAGSFIYSRRNRNIPRRSRDEENDPDNVSYMDHSGVEISTGHNIVPGIVRGGRIDGSRGNVQESEREETAYRGSPKQGPHSSLEDEYWSISGEALSWKRPSKFSMDKEKMDYKLKVKFEMGEIDHGLHNELRDFIEDHFSEGNQ